MFSRKDNTYDSLTDFSVFFKKGLSPIRFIAESIPDKAKVLDIGCGNGILAKAIKYLNKDVDIDGIEPNSFAYNIAKSNYRNVYNTLFDDNFVVSLGKLHEYDYIIFADVIEHVNDPISVLNSATKLLKKNGKIIISIPNVAFGGVRLALFKGEFDYIDSGLLERTHIRFFTLKTFKTMLKICKLRLNKLLYINCDIFSKGFDINSSEFTYQILKKLCSDEMAHVYQFVAEVDTNFTKRSETEIISVGNKYDLSISKYCLNYLKIRIKKVLAFKK